MTPLQLNKSVLTFVGVCVVEDGTPRMERFRIFLFYMLMVVMQIINIAACGLYFIKYISTDYAGAIYGFLASTVLLCLLYILITLNYHSKELRDIFMALDVIHRKGKTYSLSFI